MSEKWGVGNQLIALEKQKKNIAISVRLSFPVM
jgi:hypothetical protein